MGKAYRRVCSKDSRKISSFYIASDSRFSWTKNVKFDYGRKVFALTNSPDILGYCGDVLYLTTILNQILEMDKDNILFCERQITNAYEFIRNCNVKIALSHHHYSINQSFENIIIDNTSTTIKSRKALITRLKKNGYKIIGIFVESDLKTLCDRALESNMPISVQIRMFSQLELPDSSEGFDYIYEKSKL